VVVVIGYVVSFTFLSRSLQAGMSLGVAYGVWSGIGVAMVAMLGRWLFDDRPLRAPTRLATSGRKKVGDLSCPARSQRSARCLSPGRGMDGGRNVWAIMSAFVDRP